MSRLDVGSEASVGTSVDVKKPEPCGAGLASGLAGRVPAPPLPCSRRSDGEGFRQHANCADATAKLSGLLSHAAVRFGLPRFVSLSGVTRPIAKLSPYFRTTIRTLI